MSLTCDAPPTDSIAQFSPDELRAWRLVLRALGLLRVSLSLALIVSCVSAPLWYIMDRSERTLALVILGVGHLALAFPHGIGLLLCCFAPLGSETRRRAQQIAVLIFAGIFLALLLGAIGIGRVCGIWGGPVTLGTVMGLALAMMVLSWWVNVALVGYSSVGLHAALGRDLGHPWITTRAQRLGSVWIALCAAGGSLFLWKVFDLPISRIAAVGFPPVSIVLGLAAVALIGLEASYLQLVHQSRFALHLIICERWKVHADTADPGTLKQNADAAISAFAFPRPLKSTAAIQTWHKGQRPDR